MAELHRVAITGMGAICGLGNSLTEIWQNVMAGKSGISLIEQIDASNLPVRFAGEVKNLTLDEACLPGKDQGKFDRFNLLALHAAWEAFKQAGLEKEHPAYDPWRMGVILGVGMGGFPFIEKCRDNFKERGARRVSPFFIPAVIPNMAAGLISIQLKLQGPNYSISSACASSGHAIGAAALEIMLGHQDLMITGGAESVLSHLPISGFASMKALSTRNEEPTKASRPFDQDRDGFVIGEGSGVLILENYEKAKARGATILAEIVGQGATSDAHHITAPHPEGLGALACLKLALANAHLAPEAIDYINAHGTSTPLGDIGETKAIKQAFGDHAYKLAVSSTKSMTGHLLGA
ncbi:MAG: beta-ketoacyl-ACP synthase II, partial [Bacteriovoracaceae bacterium]|nr:beta-ketoacyl-ACP synthase II [Bacteriovoracaceae bacterium]